MYKITFKKLLSPTILSEEWDMLESLKKSFIANKNNYDVITIERFENIERLSGTKIDCLYSLKEKIMIDKYTLSKDQNNDWSITNSKE